MRPDFWQLPLDRLNHDEWEALCDGCGVCCLIKYQEDDVVGYTDVACQLLDCNSGACQDYTNRQQYVPDCVRLTLKNLPNMPWLPDTCAYKRRYLGQDLPAWHYLLGGGRAPVSVAGKCISEQGLDDEQIEARIVRWVDLQVLPKSAKF